MSEVLAQWLMLSNLIKHLTANIEYYQFLADLCVICLYKVHVV